MHSIGPILLAVIGFLLLAFCVITEGEPTLVPLVLIAASAVWYAVARARRRRLPLS